MIIGFLKTHLFNKNLSYNLGLCRILFYGLALEELWAKTYMVEVFYYFQFIPRELWTPVGIFNFYPKQMMFSLIESHMILNLLCVFLFFAMIGFITRISAFMSFILALLLLGYPNNFGTVYDSDCLFLVVSFVLIFSNMGSVLSIDNFLRRKKNLSNQDKKLNLFWSLWTVKLIVALTCLFYFTSGIQKLRFSGLDWFFSNHMAISFMHTGHPVGLFLSKFSVFSIFVAFSGLITQIFSFLPIIYSRFVLFFLILFCLFHIILDLTFGTHFDKHFIVLVFLFPWGNLLPQLPGSFKGHFWSSFSDVCKSKLRRGHWFLIAIISFVSFFVIIMSLYTPYTLRHLLYPFSTTTMYAWIDKEPIKRKVIFIVDKNNRQKRLKQSEIWPLTYDKLFTKFRSLEKDKAGGKQKMGAILRKIKESQFTFNKGLYSLEFIKKIKLAHCFWDTAENYILRPYQPDYCETLVEEDFL